MKTNTLQSSGTQGAPSHLVLRLLFLASAAANKGASQATRERLKKKIAEVQANQQ